jgi:hypothetical protein
MTVGVWPLKAIFEESSWVEGTGDRGGALCRCNIELWWCGPNSQFRLGIFVWLPESSLRAGTQAGVSWLILGLRHRKWLRVYNTMEYTYIFQSPPILLAEISCVASAGRIYTDEIHFMTPLRWREVDTFHLSWWWQHHYILPLTISKRDYITIDELQITAGFHQLAIELCTVRALQVDQVRLNFVSLVPILVDDGLEAELNHYTKLA